MKSWDRQQRLAVEDGPAQDKCPLCGIYRSHAGVIVETCGQHFLKPGCFVTGKAAA